MYARIRVGWPLVASRRRAVELRFSRKRITRTRTYRRAFFLEVQVAI